MYLEFIFYILLSIMLLEGIYLSTIFIARWLVKIKRKVGEVPIKFLFASSVGLFTSGLTIFFQGGSKGLTLMFAGIYLTILWAYADSRN